MLVEALSKRWGFRVLTRLEGGVVQAEVPVD